MQIKLTTESGLCYTIPFNHTIQIIQEYPDWLCILQQLPGQTEPETLKCWIHTDQFTGGRITKLKITYDEEDEK